MTGACFVVAFGHGSAPITVSQESAADLRDLVHNACEAKTPRFKPRVRASVAPGGVMLALYDAEPKRTIELCEAVAAQLEHQARNHTTPLPVCAAITHGYLRQVDVLGFSSNFEGWPAIAAARVVAKLAPGECAIEQSVWGFTDLAAQYSTVRNVEGKAHDAPFQVRIHQWLRFPTPRLRPAEEPVTDAQPPLPYTEVAQQARQRITELLADPECPPYAPRSSARGKPPRRCWCLPSPPPSWRPCSACKTLLPDAWPVWSARSRLT